MELTVSSSKSNSSATVTWRHKNIDVTYSYTLSADIGGPGKVVQPAIVEIDYERLTDRIIREHPNRVSKRHRAELLGQLKTSFPQYMTVGQ